MGGAVATPLPVQGVPPGLTAEPLAGQEPEIQGVPAGLTAEPVKPAAGSQQPMAGPQASQLKMYKMYKMYRSQLPMPR